MQKLKTIIPIFHDGVEKFRELDFVGDVRCIGMVAAFELVKNKKTKEAFDPKERTGYKVFQKGLKENLILRPLGDVIYLWLPLCITKTQLTDILQRTHKVIKSLNC